jgi:hypothetical protein
VRLGGGVDADVAGDEFGGALELDERLQGRHEHGGVLAAAGEVRRS